MVKEPGLWRLTTDGEEISCSFVPTIVGAGTPGPRARHAGLLVGNIFTVFGGEGRESGGETLDNTLYMLNVCKDLPSIY